MDPGSILFSIELISGYILFFKEFIMVSAK